MERAFGNFHWHHSNTDKLLVDSLFLARPFHVKNTKTKQWKNGDNAVFPLSLTFTVINVEFNLI